MATLRDTFHDIAEAIRAKGVSGTMKPIEMASKIGEIQAGGGSEDYGYLTFTAVEATTLTLKQNKIAPHKLLKSTDGVTWTKWENPSTNGISLNAGQSVYLKADEDSLWRTAAGPSSNYNYFSSTGKINCGGDIISIIKPMALVNYQYCFSCLFDSCKKLLSTPELPSTILADSCYINMFYDCTSLTTAPELPATTLAPSCYLWMFSGCTSLTTAPELPATTLAQNCYYNMFYGCTSLTSAPELPATTLAQNCYYNMFYGCTSLTKAPSVLPSQNLVYQCYQYMFYNCTSLTIAPTLPATRLYNNCYSYMFQNCKSLKRIKMNASSGNWGQNMFNGCTSLELVDMTGSTDVPTLSDVNNFINTNSTYKIVVPDSLYDKWIAATNWASIASVVGSIMKQSDWNAAHPDDQL